ncbi:2-succinyl-5-enolpyruvyl-6-hydroxy-3-cyclohexene-1-carboxylate synthase [Planctomycetota bacterium]|nr:2-succinyl-5-enolpyruvyl-6-hydroxy-3-cyclohexene-1-carboxylate synthase [Planctomycetota bacterium]
MTVPSTNCSPQAEACAPRDANLNALWCRAIAEELARGGVGLAVLCPGSRNSPLLFALADQFRDQALSHVDERSGAFIALGFARSSQSSQTPALICVTSGSALANCAPALAEAQAAHLPLIVVAADRPWELHGCSAPQTMPQAGAFRRLVDCELDLGEPVADDRAIRSLRARISRLAQRGGPALLNVPLREPLLAAPGAVWDAPANLSALARHGRIQDPYTVEHFSHPRRWPSPLVADEPDQTPRRAVVVAGAGADPKTLHGLTALGLPVLCDAINGQRDCDHPNLICHGDALVSGPLGQDPPDLVVQLGDVPLSRQVYEWLDRCTGPWVIDEPDDRDRDWLARASIRLGPRSDPFSPELLGLLRVPGDSAWCQLWRDGEVAARTALRAAMASEPWGEVLAAHAVCSHPAWRHLMLANSMAVRHGNLHLVPHPGRTVHGNRGVNGIDGQIGTLIGIALGSPDHDYDQAHRRIDLSGPTWLLTGDLALLHDLPALAALASLRKPGAIIVLNNDGGGLFDFLPVAQHTGYQHWVRTSHGLTFAGIANQFGLRYRRCTSRAELDAALTESAAEPTGWSLVECAVSGLDTVQRHRSLLKAMSG